MALRGHPRYRDRLKITRLYSSLKGDYCVAEYEGEADKRYYLPKQWLSSELPPLAPEPADDTITLSLNALHKMVQLVESQNQRWRVSKSDEGKGSNQPTDLEASSQAAENTTQQPSVFPNSDSGRRNST